MPNLTTTQNPLSFIRLRGMCITSNISNLIYEFFERYNGNIKSKRVIEKKFKYITVGKIIKLVLWIETIYSRSDCPLCTFEISETKKNDMKFPLSS